MSIISEASSEKFLGVNQAGSLPRGLRVLVVEDDDADAYLITRALSENPRVGVVSRAVDGVEALELINSGVEPDLAIIDLHMPRKNGLSLLLELTCAEWVFPKIVLTSSTISADAVRSRLRGAADVLIKPAAVEDLQKMLGAAIAAA